MIRDKARNSDHDPWTHRRIVFRRHVLGFGLPFGLAIGVWLAVTQYAGSGWTAKIAAIVGTTLTATVLSYVFGWQLYNRYERDD